MTWAKLSDDYSDDCWTLSDKAFRLHTEALVWNGRKLLDCRIPKDDLRRFAKHADAVAELLAVGWWTEDGAHYVIRHHAQYQRPREAVLKQQEANTRNGMRGGRPKRTREQARDLSSTSETQSVGESPSGSETERDRTGQDRQGLGSAQKRAHDDDAWLSYQPVDLGALPGRCSSCGFHIQSQGHAADCTEEREHARV